jgi:hypothetical protein
MAESSSSPSQGENALLVKPRDTTALLTGLQQLLGDADLRHRLAQGGLKTAAERAWGRSTTSCWRTMSG